MVDCGIVRVCMVQICLDCIESETILSGMQRVVGFFWEQYCLRGPLSFAKHGGEHGALKGCLKVGSACSARGPTQHPADQMWASGESNPCSII